MTTLLRINVGFFSCLFLCFGGLLLCACIRFVLWCACTGFVLWCACIGVLVLICIVHRGVLVLEDTFQCALLFAVAIDPAAGRHDF